MMLLTPDYTIKQITESDFGIEHKAIRGGRLSSFDQIWCSYLIEQRLLCTKVRMRLSIYTS